MHAKEYFYASTTYKVDTVENESQIEALTINPRLY